MPDAHAFGALDLDMGIYGAARAWDDETSCVEETAAMLREHVADPRALAETLIEHVESEEDPERVAQALVEPMPDLARGPAEEAATFVRVFLEYVPQALELRTPAKCECAVWDGQTVGTGISFSPREFEITGESPTKGQLRCKRCEARYTFEIFSNYAQVARVTTPLPELRTDLVGLLPWIEERCAAQTSASQAARAAFMAKLEREATTPAPELAQVMGVLRDGFPIQVGGGRSFPTYQMKDGQLIVIQSDDGYTEERPCSEATLRAAIADAPNVFADAVRWYGTKH